MSDVFASTNVINLPLPSERMIPMWSAALMEALPVGVYICDASGLLVGFNRQAARLWGRSPQIGDTEQRFCGAHKLFRPDGTHLPFEQTPMAEALSSGAPMSDQEVQIERPDGSRIWALVNIHPLINESGMLTGAVNCFLDISARKRAEDAIKEGERRLRDLIEALPAAVYTTDPQGRLTFYNKAASHLWGYEPRYGEATWCGSWRLYHLDGTPLPHEECPMALALRQQRPIRGAEAVAERPDGTRVTFAPYPTPLHDEKGNLIGAVNMLVDITERKASEERLRLLAREVDHRAKNMLSVIQAVVHLTQADSVPALKHAIDGRIAALARAHSLLSESRWEGADLRELVKEEVSPFFSEGEARVVIDGPNFPLPPELAQSLAMVIHELATNALKHGALRQSGASVEVRWWSDLDGRLLFRWTEKGCLKVEPPTSRGFGLRVIDSTICRQLGGTVELDWRTDGLRFELEVPVTHTAVL